MVTPPLDLFEIFANHLAGSPAIFWILGIILIIIVAAQTRMPMGAVMIFTLVFTFITFAGDTGDSTEAATVKMIMYIAFILFAIIFGFVWKRVVAKN